MESMTVSETDERRPPPVDQAALREVCGRFLTGVTVIACQGDGREPAGLTVNSFTSVSLDPALVLFCVHTGSRMLSEIRAAGAFAVSFLAADQATLCRSFARRESASFEGVPHLRAATGSPVLTGALAHLDCRFRATYPGGDHRIVLGEVVGAGLQNEQQPLAFYRSGHPRLEART